MSRLVTARDNHITRWVLPTASRLLIEAACKDAPIRHLDEVVHIEMGQSPSGESCNQDGDGVLLIGGPADLGLKFPNATRWTNQPTKLCRNGDIVICVRATIGEPRWADGVYCLGRGVAGLRPLDSKLNSRFLFRIIEGNEDWLRSQGTGTTFKTISKVHLARIKVPIIPKHEQEQIGSFLDWLEDSSITRPDFSSSPALPERLSEQRRLVAKIEALAAKIEEIRSLRGETSQEANTLLKAAKNSVFSLSNKWISKSLEEIAPINMGQSPPGYSYNVNGEGIPLLNGPTEFGNLNPIPIQWTTAPTKLCKIGDILLCVRGATTGKMNWADREYCIGRGLAALTVDTNICDPRFVYHFIENQTYEMLSLSAGSTFPNLPGAKLKFLQIPVPPQKEQRRIVAYLDALQTQVNALKKLQAQTAAELDALLPAILDRAFKGQL